MAKNCLNNKGGWCECGEMQDVKQSSKLANRAPFIPKLLGWMGRTKWQHCRTIEYGVGEETGSFAECHLSTVRENMFCACVPCSF